ncbi:VOC family protein [Aquirufa ecclesiirivi]|uniref:VOC family protein n=1 Tax=Aquirufa ecclesiirivi TaxID=2715124 RepID=UPI003BB06679
MSKISTYLNFPGNAEEAFLFYQSIFKTEFVNGIQRFADIATESKWPPMSDAVKNMISHIELPLLNNHILMASDAPSELGFTVTAGNNMHICVETGSKEEAQRIFDGLSEGAAITMPIQDMFWGAYYGTLTDQFGINWMITFTAK